MHHRADHGAVRQLPRLMQIPQFEPLLSLQNESESESPEAKHSRVNLHCKTHATGSPADESVMRAGNDLQGS